MTYGKQIDLWLTENQDRHQCKSHNKKWECYEWYEFDLLLSDDNGGEISVNYCPFCGFKSRKGTMNNG